MLFCKAPITVEAAALHTSRHSSLSCFSLLSALSDCRLPAPYFS
ncbi:hypothetical protein PR048_018584 [Dryococelus australis]|uniref:Uncharacterized protein n=1 Tax=Dryococelus australis TaxID=614101 RepID=A0ABQ9HD33_9NEOP|nr:hypothetical protein PR048_018584 [Dryococelus australis]